MKESHSNFNIIRCGILINEEYHIRGCIPHLTFYAVVIVRKAVVRSSTLSVLS